MPTLYLSSLSPTVSSTQKTTSCALCIWRVEVCGVVSCDIRVVFCGFCGTGKVLEALKKGTRLLIFDCSGRGEIGEASSAAELSMRRRLWNSSARNRSTAVGVSGLCAPWSGGLESSAWESSRSMSPAAAAEAACEVQRALKVTGFSLVAPPPAAR